jgi:hypothetical protein
VTKIKSSAVAIGSHTVALVSVRMLAYSSYLVSLHFPPALEGVLQL